jgi:hypothetical protein
MRVVQVLATGHEIDARRTEAYGEIPDDRLVSDASAIRFESMEPIEATPPVDHDGVESVFRESRLGHTDPHLIEAIGKALKAVEGGGSLQIDIQSTGNERTTRIRYSRGG